MLSVFIQMNDLSCQRIQQIVHSDFGLPKNHVIPNIHVAFRDIGYRNHAIKRLILVYHWKAFNIVHPHNIPCHLQCDVR